MNLAELSTEELVGLCIRHTNPSVIQAVLRLGSLGRRPSRQQVKAAAQRAGVPVQSISHWFGYGIGLGSDELVDLSRGGCRPCQMPSTPEAGFGLLVFIYTMRPEIRLHYSHKH